MKLRCRLGFHAYVKVQIPVIDPETGIQSMFISQHCDRWPYCKAMRIFSNWRYPWESKHSLIKR